MKGPSPAARRLRGLAFESFVLAVVYLVTARVGLRLAFANKNVTAVWPPTGVAVAAILLRGRRVWPGVAIGALVANLANGAPALMALGFSIGNTLAPLVGAEILRRAGFRRSLERPADVYALAFGGGLAAMLISATGGTLTLVAAGALGRSSIGFAWLVWWIGDAMGVILVAPLILIMVDTGFARFLRQPVDSMLTVAAIACGGWFVFAQHLPLAYVALLIALVAALRGGQFGAATATFVVSGIAIWATVHGFGAFGRVVGSSSGDLLVLQTFNATVAMTSLTLAAVITQRKRAEEEMSGWNAQLEDRVHERSSLLEESQHLARIGSFSWDAFTDTNTWTDELYRIYGMTPGEVAPSFERYMSMVHPDFHEHVQTSVDEAIAAGHAFQHDYRINLPSAETRWVHASGEIVTDDQGNMTGLRGTCQDITERKRAENAVRASEKRFGAVIESAPDPVIVVDESGRIVLMNNEATVMFGYTADELIGHSVDVLLPEALHGEHSSHREAYMSDPRRRPMGSDRELWAQSKDGGLIPVDISLSPVATDDGTLIVAVVRDITDRKQAEESMRAAYERQRDAADRLRALDETKTVFLEAVSHELRTPLTVIVGVSSLLRLGDLAPGDGHFDDLVASLDSSSQRLEQLLDDLLDLDRLGRGIVKPHRRPTYVAELITRVVGVLDAGRHPVYVDAHEVVANIDPATTERIVENLVANALVHTPPETPIWARAEPADDGVVIVVEDAGPGVPENIRETLFAPFVKDTRGHVPGTGIGLSLVLRFATLHGGGAWVSDRPGGGTCFHVYLPSSDAPMKSSSHDAVA